VGTIVEGDRATAIAHGQSVFDVNNPNWQSRRNFQVVANSPELARVQLTQIGELTKFSHPASSSITVDLGLPDSRAALADWVGLLPGARPGPYTVAQLGDQAMTDMKPPFVSIHTTASLIALSDHLGVAPNPHRYRGNLWFDEADAWVEESWIGKEITVGTTRFKVMEPIGRCKAPEANPDTGLRDAEVTKKLHGLRGTTNFGVYAEVITSGSVKTGDSVKVH